MLDPTLLHKSWEGPKGRFPDALRPCQIKYPPDNNAWSLDVSSCEMPIAYVTTRSSAAAAKQRVSFSYACRYRLASSSCTSLDTAAVVQLD